LEAISASVQGPGIRAGAGSSQRRLAVSGVIFEHVTKLRDILARLDAARTVADMNLPGLRLHPLKGDLKGLWAVTVRANWRVVFRFADPDAFDVDYLDYH
jgi:proteic killer suppression protein